MEPTEKVLHEQSRQGWYAVALLLGFILALRLAASFLIPFGQNVEHHLEGLNDEPAHFNYVKYLVKHRAFPVLEHWVLEPDAFTRNEFEYHQAPLYYLLCAPFYPLFGENGARAACRLLSVLFGMASLLVISLVLRDCGCPARMRLAAVLFLGLLPSHVYFTSLVSNDALSWLLALLLTRSILLYGTTASAAAGTAMVTMSVYLAAGALTKGSLLIFFPVVLGVFIYKYYVSGDLIHCIRGCSVVAAAGIAALPWYVRNLYLYHSLLGTPPAPEYPFSLVPGALGLVKTTVKYFWFPMQHLHGGTAAYYLLVACGSAVIAAHIVFVLVRAAQKRRMNVVIGVLSAILLLAVAAYVWYFMEWRNPEARFLFPALGPIVFFFIVPAYQFFARLKIERYFLPYLLAVSLFPYLFLFFTG